MEITAVDNTITAEAQLFEDAQQQRLHLRLITATTQYGGEIIFLPIRESEQFNVNGGIRDNGGNISTEGYIRTNYINVEGAKECVYFGRCPSSALCSIFGYDENQSPVRILLDTSTQTYENVHIPIPEDIKYIRACSSSAVEPSLIVYFEEIEP